VQDVNNGQNIRLVTGVEENGLIAWPATNTQLVNGTGKVFDHTGTVQGGAMRLRFTGVNGGSQRTEGEYELIRTH
jgi:hypothetical protein